MRAVSDTWDEAIQRFRNAGGDTDAARAYVMLLESARARWQSVVAVHPWRLDLLDLTPRRASPHTVQAEFRVRDGKPVVQFRLGPTGSMSAAPTISGDICFLETAPMVLDAFLLQIAVPDATPM